MKMLDSWRLAGVLTAITVFLAGTIRSESSARPDEKIYVIGLSPFLERGAKDEVYRKITAFLLESVPLGSTVWICDAYHQRTIARLEVPNVRAFTSAKTRANQFQNPVGKLKQFLLESLGQPDSSMNLKNAIRLPQFIDFATGNLLTQNCPATVILLGSPLYLDPREPAFSMIDGYFPTDGHLIATREKSPFGLNDRTATAAGLTVHFGWFGEPWLSDVHQEKVTRFWTLFLQGRGARLATFTGDLATVFYAADFSRTGSGSLPRYEIDPSQTKLEMVRITRDISNTDWITQDVVQRRTGPPATPLGPMKIGIRWRGNIDLDLYAAASRSAETLFFEHTRTAEGYYFRDHRSSPDREYEFIEFESPVDVRQVQARINFYEGRFPGGAKGEVRIEFERGIYSGEFSIPASHGNQGRDGGSQSEYWTGINIPAILGLEPRGGDTTAQSR